MQTWNPEDKDKDNFAHSSVEMLHRIEETMDAFVRLSIPIRSTLLADLTAGLDKCLHYYVSNVKSGCGKYIAKTVLAQSNSVEFILY